MRALRLLALPFVLALGGSALAVESPVHKLPAVHVTAAPIAPESARASRSRAHHGLHGTANLNLADEATLELLPGIGEVMAMRIVEHRKAHPYRKVEDVTKVKGIGKKKLAKLRPFLSITGASTLAEDDAPPAGASRESGEDNE